MTPHAPFRRYPPRSLLLACLAVAAAAGTAAASPLAEVHSAATPARALELANALAADPQASRTGIDYLRGHLLEQIGKTAAAERAFSLAMQRSPELAGHARYRLARLQLAEHPEVAAGLAAPLLSHRSPPALRHQAAQLLLQALAAGGDCRLLESADLGSLSPGDRRALEVRRADCAASPARATLRQRLATLVADEPGDEAAREAAMRLAALGPRQPDLEIALAVGRAFQRHRRPDLAISFLAPLTSRLPEQLREQRDVEALQLLGLSQLARDQPEVAAATFARLAARVHRPEQRAEAFFHEGRARELGGDPAAALSRYVRAANQTPANVTTGPALLAACRLQWLRGDRAAAVHTLGILRSRAEWNGEAGRAALFFAASLLAAGEVGDAPTFLDTATATLGTLPEVVYWKGRADEARQRPDAAVGHYLRLARDATYHPLALDARARMARPPLLASAAALAATKRGSARGDDRRDAWLLLPAGDPGREPLRQMLYQRYARDPELAPWLRLAPVAPESWPLWQAPHPTAEDRLLALGGWGEVGLDTVLRHFPLRDVALSFTAAQRLAAAGDLPRAQILGGELMHRLGGRIPLALLPLPLRQLLLPRPWRPEVESAAARHGVDPALLWALMREGSSFDSKTLSPSGGRGLMVLDPRQAAPHAAAAGLTTVRPEDLFAPRHAIPIAAARLAELATAFPDRPALALAAYLSTPAQARAWSRRCTSSDPAEQLTKIGSDDVRAATARVLATAAAYRELYAP